MSSWAPTRGILEFVITAAEHFPMLILHSSMQKHALEGNLRWLQSLARSTLSMTDEPVFPTVFKRTALKLIASF